MRDISKPWLNYCRARTELVKSLGEEQNIEVLFGLQLISEAYGSVSRIDASSSSIFFVDGSSMAIRIAMNHRRGPARLAAINNWDFETLVILMFDENGYIDFAAEIDVAQARELSEYDKVKNSWYIDFDPSLFRSGLVHDVSEKLMCSFGDLFIEHTRNKQEQGTDPLSTMKNKAFAMKCIQMLKNDSSTLQSDINALMDDDYCKQVLGHSFAVLKRVTGLSDKGIASEARDSHGNRRYYESPIPIGNESFIVSNDWYGLGVGNRDNRSPFIKWVRERVKD